MTWLDKYHDTKELFIKKHSSIRKARNALLWFEYHLFRGKNYWASWIDFLKYWAGLVVVLASLEYLKVDLGIQTRYLLLFSGIAIIILMVFCIIWSQIMDILKWTEAQAEFANTRNWLFIELRNFFKEVLGEKRFKKVMEAGINKSE